MARIHIKKPVDGVTEVYYDASRGPTRYRARSGPIKVEDVVTVVQGMADEYMERRRLANALRKHRLA